MPPNAPSSTLQFRRLSDARAMLGESPVWDASANAVWWVDIDGSKVFKTDAETGATRVWPAPEFAGCVAVSATGQIVVGMETGLFLLNCDSGAFTCVVDLGRNGVRFNDSTVDRNGTLWAAIMDVDNTKPIGTLFRITPDFTVTEVMSGFITPNGLAVDAERGRLYVSDSHPSIQTVWWHPIDLDDGSVGERHDFFPMHDHSGRPDGATLDADGNYWIAGVGGAAVHKLDPDGTHLAEYATPMPAPTKPVFGGADLTRIFLTSKADETGGEGGHLTVADTSENGSAVTLFGARPDAREDYSAVIGK
ncbi:SMP-30/gluconolactonase/LRE family protein [Hwanghaeella grinnelliae]|nr:SMP-30/gluconolactonase/LRE family protein [Hwanghaeella grinnelliae]